MRKLLRLLLSRKYAASALGLLAVLMALAALVPDAEKIEDLGHRHPAAARILGRLRPAEVARSPVVALLAGYVAAAVVASMATRIRARRSAARRDGPPPLERFAVRRQLRLDAPLEAAERRVRAAARRLGFAEGQALSGARGGVGFWGSMAFHAGLLLALAGVVLSARYRFGGELVLTEGFPFQLSPAIFLRAEPAGALAGLASTRLAVSDITATYQGGTQLTDVSAVLTVRRPGEPPDQRFVSVNVPVDVGGFQLTVRSYGYAPELRAVDGAGDVRAAGNVMLHLLPPGTEDAVVLTRGGTLRLRFFPDHVIQDGRDATRSMFPENPVLAFRWYEGGELVAEGRVRRGEEARVAGHRVAFPDFARWLDLVVARDPGVPWFTAGSLLAAVGLAVRMVFYEQAWQARLEPGDGATVVELALSARYHPAALEERAARFAAAIEGSAGA